MSASHGIGHTAYIDPLLLNETLDRRGKKSDIFSLGVILWEISSGRIPCEGYISAGEVVLCRLQGFRDLPFPGTPEEYIELYSECWNEDPAKRPFCEEVYKRLLMLSEQLIGQSYKVLYYHRLK